MSPELFALISVRTGAVAYAALSVFFLIGWIRGISGRAALAAAAITTGWFVSLDLLGPRPIVDLLEVSAYSAWTFLLLRALGAGLDSLSSPERRPQIYLAGLAGALFVGALGYFAFAPARIGPALEVAPSAALLTLGACLTGLVTIEQLVRNTRRDGHWNLKFLSIGLAILFGYGFVLHADRALFQATNLAFTAVQGLIAATAVPFIAIASLRSRQRALNFNLSRRFVFRSGMLIATGLYLLTMGAAGYYVRLFGGEWGQVVQVLVVAASLIALVAIASSTTLRNRLRVAILRNLFEYKYDYRDEWLKVTRALSEDHPDESLPQRAIGALAEIVHADSGRYYRLSPQGVLLPISERGSRRTPPLSPLGSASLTDFCNENNWIVDLDEYRVRREAYPGLDLDADLPLLTDDRFIVPLPVEELLFGIVVLGRPSHPVTLIWEDYDILKVIARQSAAFLALQHADRELATSAQLRAMNQISAFVVHDLKTVAAQLSLMLDNAPRHRSNPAFVDDMLKTTANAVGRMNRLLDQLRDRRPATVEARCVLADVAHAAIEQRAAQTPVPTIASHADGIEVRADREQLVNVLSHVIQNAQEATTADGAVSVTLGREHGWATVAVRDTGCGMTAEFIERALFRPFATTKGVSGIGIGAYQSREYLRSIGGDLIVRSEPGRGSEFVLRLPIPDTAEGARP
jgi:putative PEP-CTERM system histidine kinase